MKRLDYTIIKSIIFILLGTFITGLIINTIITLKILGIILAIGYFVFMMLHLGLCYPSFVIGCVVSDFIDTSFKYIYNQSIILAHTYRVIIVLFSILASHLIWSYLAVSLCTNEYGLDNYFLTMRDL